MLFVLKDYSLSIHNLGYRLDKFVVESSTC
jgi:hypothetical protein